MRQKKHFKYAALLRSLLAIIAVALIVTACQKNQKETIPPVEKDALQEAAKLLNGEVVWGQVDNVATEEGVVYLDFDKGKKAIFIQIPDGEKAIGIPSIENAGVISSSHGIIIKDPSSQRVLLFPQNDTESLKMFEKVSSLFKEGSLSSPIAGTTLLNFNS